MYQVINRLLKCLLRGLGRSSQKIIEMKLILQLKMTILYPIELNKLSKRQLKPLSYKQSCHEFKK